MIVQPDQKSGDLVVNTRDHNQISIDPLTFRMIHPVGHKAHTEEGAKVSVFRQTFGHKQRKVANMRVAYDGK